MSTFFSFFICALVSPALTKKAVFGIVNQIKKNVFGIGDYSGTEMSGL